MYNLSPALMAILIAGSVFTMAYVLLRIRKEKMQIEDALFWLLFGVLLIILSVFPGLSIWAATQLGVQSPINFVYLFILFLLLLKLFLQSVKVSQLEVKIRQLSQTIALNEHKAERQVKEQNEKNKEPANREK